MATVRKVICRDHPGGRFVAPPRRGRPPVRCAPEYPCSAAETAISAKKPTRKELAAKRDALEAADKAARAPRHQPKTVAAKELIAVGTDEGPAATQERVQATIAGREASLAKARKAKAELEARGWTVEGKGKGTQAEITAVRDDEMLIMVWDNGTLTAQDYSLWAADKPRENGMPASELPAGLDLDTMSDRELLAALVGMQVTWWNRLGQRKESAIISTKRVAIEHVYDQDTIARGAMPSQRIIKFVDVNAGGYKAFQLGALLKIG